jgi:site-specific DNA-methyltransferase (adenine-specific)
VTDPPYGLAFMGKKWDYSVPSVEIWRAVLRVMKPGAHLFSFGGTRTYHRMVCAIEDAGFDIRDQVQWIYGSGFPKSHNLKDEWSGWGTALKPANEPICLARKPLSEKTVAANVLKWGCGAINVDASRISANGEKIAYGATKDKAPDPNCYGKYSLRSGDGEHAQGRWPANVLFDEEAAEMLDEQSGKSKSGGGKSSGKTFHGQEYIKDHNERPTDHGGASRFFYVAKASKRERNAGLEGMPLMDAPGSKRSAPAEGRSSALGEPRANGHPTVKPIKLMQYLCKLITPHDGTILDPFMGSGSTGVAAKSLGFEFIGIELSQEYFKIAEKRIDAT